MRMASSSVRSADIGSWIDQRRGELVSLLQALIRARSENPPGDERAPAAIVQHQLRDLGADVRVVEAAPGRISVIGEFRGSRPSAALLADAHLDTVPAGPGWSVDPFAGELREGTIYGRGAIDHKSPIAALLYAAAALKQSDRLPSRLVLVFDADEELGGEHGMRRLLREVDLDVHCALYAVPTSFSREGAQFFGHGRDNVFSGSIGLIRLRVTYDTRVSYGVAPGEWWYTPEVAAAVAGELREALPSPRWFGGRPRARLREGGDASQLWEVAVLPEEEPAVLVEIVRRVVERAAGRFAGAIAELERLDTVPPAHTSDDSPLVRALIEGARVATGRTPQVGQLAIVTGMSQIQERLAVPIAAFGYGRIELCHVPDEHIAIDDVVAMSVAYAEAMARLS